MGLPKVAMDYAEIEDTVDKEQADGKPEETHKQKLLIGLFLFAKAGKRMQF